ncbi:MAG TPA: hypothetical protein VGH54_05620 [Mycobacterium sp.]|jgi:hypothetical protein|uniref:hypothetical protein n=1 Tax=Mycobacterium sp. TaxID=1785 RepID=UPI002F405D9F
MGAAVACDALVGGEGPAPVSTFSASRQSIAEDGLMEILWPLGLVLVLGLAKIEGGWPLLIVVSVGLALVFKALGDAAAKR